MGHIADVSLAKVFPGGARVATGCLDGSVIIWDAKTCKPLRRITTPGSAVGVAVVGDGARLAVLSSTGKTTIWDAGSGLPVRLLLTSNSRIADRVFRIEAVPGSDMLATASLRGVSIWHTGTGELVHHLESIPEWTRNFAIAPGGDLIATCSVGSVIVWDVSSGRQLRSFGDLDPGQHGTDESEWCFLGVGLGAALDPQSFVRNLSLHDLRSWV